MAEAAPHALKIRHAESTQSVLEAGTPLPCERRVVMATQRAGQDAFQFDVIEGDKDAVGTARLPLPRGLPANCWLAVFFRVGQDGRVAIEAKENLRRINISAECQVSSKASQFYWL